MLILLTGRSLTFSNLNDSYSFANTMSQGGFIFLQREKIFTYNFLIIYLLILHESIIVTLIFQ